MKHDEILDLKDGKSLKVGQWALKTKTGYKFRVYQNSGPWVIDKYGRYHNKLALINITRSIYEI